MFKPYVSALLMLQAMFCGFVSSCERGRTPQTISQSPLRAGTQVFATQPRYLDEAPSVSADGTRVVFTSGRASSNSQQLKKIFTLEWPEDSAPQDPKALLSSSELAEQKAIISPDGFWVAVETRINENHDLYLVPFDASTPPVRLTDDQTNLAEESYFRFSADSKGLAWISKTKGSKALFLRVISVEEPRSTRDFSGKHAEISDFTWAPVASGYALILASKEFSSFRFDYEEISFVSLESGQEESKRSVIQEGLSKVNNIRVLATTEQIFFTRGILAGEDLRVEAQEPQASKTTLAVLSELVSIPRLATDTSRSIKTISPHPGSEILDSSMSKDGAMLFAVARQAWRCSSDQETPMQFATTMLETSSQLNSFQRVLPLYHRASDSWQIISNFCEDRPEKTLIDGQIRQVEINGNATSKNSRILYVTQFSQVLDKECRPILGDTEIMALEVKEDQRVIQRLSRNPDPFSEVPGPADPSACL